MTDEQGALWMPNSNFFSGRAGCAVRWIILHGTAGGTSAQAIGAYFQSTQDSGNPVSSHYIIGQDGAIVQCVREADSAWGNGGLSSGHDPWWQDSINPNYQTISIEHCKPSAENSDALTEPQQAASFQLVRDICQRWDIPQRQADPNGGITGHFSIDPVNRARCPGTYPWSDLWNYLSGEEDMLSINDPFAAKHFTQTSATCWHCTAPGHAFDIHDAILDYWRRTQGAFRLPVSNEIYGVIASCSFQVFEAGVLCYDPKNSYDNPGLGAVYAMHLDQDTPALRQLLALAGLTIAPPTPQKGQ